MRDDVVPEDRRVVVADLVEAGSVRCVLMYAGRCTYAVVEALLQVCYDYHLQSHQLARQVEKIDARIHTESFLLRRMKSGPGVNAAFAMGTTVRAVQIRELENFMMLSRFGLC